MGLIGTTGPGSCTILEMEVVSVILQIFLFVSSWLGKQWLCFTGKFDDIANG